MMQRTSRIDSRPLRATQLTLNTYPGRQDQALSGADSPNTPESCRRFGALAGVFRVFVQVRLRTRSTVPQASHDLHQRERSQAADVWRADTPVLLGCFVQTSSFRPR